MDNTWFNCKISFLKQLENGSISKKTESYLLNAMSFTEAEARLTAILEEYIVEFQLMACSKVKVNAVVIDEAKEKYFKTKVAYVSFDEESGKEKRINEIFIVQADSLTDAYDKTKERLAGSIVDWEIPAITEYNIMDIFPYEEGAIKETADQEDEEDSAE